jgi:hypothetical protein
MMASAVPHNLSATLGSLSANPSRNPRCLRAATDMGVGETVQPEFRLVLTGTPAENYLAGSRRHMPSRRCRR